MEGSGEGRRLPLGITSITGYDLDMSLIIYGTPDAIASVKQKVAMLDVKARELRITVRLLHTTIRPVGGPDIRVRREFTFNALNNAPTKLTMQDFARDLSASILP